MPGPGGSPGGRQPAVAVVPQPFVGRGALEAAQVGVPVELGGDESGELFDVADSRQRTDVERGDDPHPFGHRHVQKPARRVG